MKYFYNIQYYPSHIFRGRTLAYPLEFIGRNKVSVIGCTNRLDNFHTLKEITIQDLLLNHYGFFTQFYINDIAKRWLKDLLKSA